MSTAILLEAALSIREQVEDEWCFAQRRHRLNNPPTGCGPCDSAVRLYEPPRDEFLLGIAAWLEHVATFRVATPDVWTSGGHHTHALAVAREYLGRDT